MSQANNYPEHSLTTLGNLLDSMFDAVKLCKTNRLFVPSLILLYSAIDIIAGLDRATNHPSAKRGDFIRWVSDFVLPDSGLPCTAHDLYGARCGLVHAYAPGSDLSRKGEVAPIHYAWGTASAEALRQTTELLNDQSSPKQPVSIHVDDLIAAVRAGTRKFIDTLGEEPSRMELVLSRVSKVFSNMPKSLLEDFLQSQTSGYQ